MRKSDRAIITAFAWTIAAGLEVIATGFCWDDPSWRIAGLTGVLVSALIVIIEAHRAIVHKIEEVAKEE